MLSTKPTKLRRGTEPEGDSPGELPDVYSLTPPEERKPLVTMLPPSPLLGPVQGDEEFSDRFPWRSTGCVVLATVGLLAISARSGFMLGQIASVIVGLSAMLGLWRGGVRKVSMLLAMLVVGSLALQYHDWCEPAFDLVLGRPSELGNWLATGGVSVVGLLMVHGWAARFRRRVVRIRRRRVLVDRIVGAMVGVGEGATGVLVICWMTVMLAPALQRARGRLMTEPGSVRARIAEAAVEIGHEAGQGMIGRIVEATNVLDISPEVRGALDDFNRTGELSLDGVEVDLPTIMHEMLDRVFSPDDGVTISRASDSARSDGPLPTMPVAVVTRRAAFQHR